MNRAGIIAYVAAIAGVALIVGCEVIAPSQYLYDNRTGASVTLGAFGWLAATLGPIALSMYIWRWARRSDARWALHLLFLPCAIAIYRGGAGIIFFAAGVPDDDSIEGYMLVPATCYLALTLLVHGGASVALMAVKVGRHLKGN